MTLEGGKKTGFKGVVVENCCPHCGSPNTEPFADDGDSTAFDCLMCGQEFQVAKTLITPTIPIIFRCDEHLGAVEESHSSHFANHS